MSQFQIIYENTDDTFATTDSLVEAIHLAQEAARQGEPGELVTILETKGKAVRQFLLLPDGTVEEQATVDQPKRDGVTQLLRWLFWMFWIVILPVLVALFVTVWMNWPSNRVIKQWHQPKAIDYKSFDPYTVSAIEGALNWNDLGLSRRHYLFIGRGAEAPSYGVYLDYKFHAGLEDTDTYINRCSVKWTAKGLTFVEPSGNQLFIPKENFIGGR